MSLGAGTTHLHELAPSDAILGQAIRWRHPWRWDQLGRVSNTRLWGTSTQSGHSDGRTVVDTTAGIFRCSCSATQPCQHALGLALLGAQTALPDAAIPTPFATTAARPPAVATPNWQHISTATADLTLWLEDLIGDGLASLPGRPADFWQTMQARLHSAQLHDMARQLDAVRVLVQSETSWTEPAVRRLGRLYLQARLPQQRAVLRPEIVNEWRLQLDFAPASETLEPVADCWLVLARTRTLPAAPIVNRRAERERPSRSPNPRQAALQARTAAAIYSRQQSSPRSAAYVWLLGRHSGRFAYLPTPAGPNHDRILIPGLQLQTTLHFHTSIARHRAQLQQAPADMTPMTSPPSATPLQHALQQYRIRLAHAPWLGRWPLLLRGRLTLVGNRPFILSDDGTMLPLLNDISRTIALTASRPANFFGLYDGEHVTLWALFEHGIIRRFDTQ